MQYWNSDEVTGFYDADIDGFYPPPPGTGETLRLSFSEADSYYILKVGSGEAYVQGFNVGVAQSIYLYGNKPRTQSFRPNSVTTIKTPFDVKLTNVFNLPDVANITGTVDTLAFDATTPINFFTDSSGILKVKSDGTGFSILCPNTLIQSKP